MGRGWIFLLDFIEGGRLQRRWLCNCGFCAFPENSSFYEVIKLFSCLLLFYQLMLFWWFSYCWFARSGWLLQDLDFNYTCLHLIQLLFRWINFYLAIIRFFLPFEYIRCLMNALSLQESEEGNWHVPTVIGDDLESPRQWICATRTRTLHSLFQWMLYAISLTMVVILF